MLKRKLMKQAMSHLDQTLNLHNSNGNVLPSEAVEHIEKAREIIQNDESMTPHWQEK